MHPRKMYNPNRGKKHAARLPGHSSRFPASQVRYSRRDPVERRAVPITAA
jgi:hypothetical protein